MSEPFARAYDLPHLPEDAPLQRFFPAAKRRHQVETYPVLESLGGAFSSNLFQLESVPTFLEASTEDQATILARCSQEILEEACLVEKAGVAYAARMVLEARSIEERILYGWIAAEEADHLSGITSLLGSRTPIGTQDVFLRYLEGVISTGSRPVLLFVVQVILEGWGLHHYKTLAHQSQDPELKRYFQRILSDEARHHGSGEVLFEDLDLADSDLEAVVTAMETFLGMVQVGPMRVLSALTEVLSLDLERQTRAFRELEGQAHAQERLDRLAQLMHGKNAQKVRHELSQRGCFQPLDPAQILGGRDA